MEICSLKWNTPFSCLISGPSQSGKTEIIKNIINSNEILMKKKFDVIFYFYKTYQESYDSILNNKVIFFLNSIITNEDSLINLIDNYKKNNILFVFDDLQNEIESNKDFFTKIWTIYIHHYNISCIGILHNLFTKNIRTISLNTHKIILTQNLRDTTQIRILSQQAFPRKKIFLTNVFNAISNKSYPYILLDFAPSSGNSYIRVLCNIFTHEHPMIAFKESDCNPYEKLIIISEDYYKCLTSNENCENSINSKSSAVNNINLNNKIFGNETKYNDEERSREKSGESSREKINKNETSEEKNNLNYKNDIISSEKEKNSPLLNNSNSEFTEDTSQSKHGINTNENNLNEQNEFNNKDIKFKKTKIEKKSKKIVKSKNKLPKINEIFKRKEKNIDSDIEMKLDEPMNESEEGYSSNVSDEEMENESMKISKKRKGRKITNTRIHPYKIYKYNHGEKRKLIKNNNIQKIKKLKNNYRKWEDN